MRGSTHPPLGMRCWKCFCIMPSIVMRSPLLSLGFYEKFGIAIDGTDDWCIYWCDACCKVAWVSQVPSHPPDVKVYSLALHKHLRAQNFIRCRESWFPHLRPGPSQFKPTCLSQGQRNNTSAVRHCETYHMISCLHFQLLTWKWNHEFKDSMDFTQVLNPLTFAAVTLISSNFPWKRASSSACQPSEAAPSWDGSASSVYMFSAQIQRFAECTCNCCVFAPLIACAS